MYSLSDYDYALPKALIAQRPAAQRDQSRLLCLDRKTGGISHRRFGDVRDLLAPSDVLVVNNTAVVPGRLFGKKASGGKVEVLILDYAPGHPPDSSGGLRCECLIRSSKRPRPGAEFLFDEGLTARVLDAGDGRFTVAFYFNGDFEALLDRIGHVPLPPYIRRNGSDPCDKTAYQTVYASRKGAVAAPTAGLHFSGPILEGLKKRGVRIAEITLHVGYGTFLPVRSADIRQHRMHSEWYHFPPAAADLISRAKAAGNRIVAVGSTSVRTLEYAADPFGNIRAGSGACDLFIYPGYAFKMVDAVLTNFHLPRSTLLMLVSAFAGRERILGAYAEAVDRGYRFFSYGDAMLIT